EAPGVDTACSEVLAEGSIEDRIAHRSEFVYYFRGDEEHGFGGAPMDLRMCLLVAFEAKWADLALRYRALGNTSGRDIDLDDLSSHNAMGHNARGQRGTGGREAA